MYCKCVSIVLHYFDFFLSYIIIFYFFIYFVSLKSERRGGESGLTVFYHLATGQARAQNFENGNAIIVEFC